MDSSNVKNLPQFYANKSVFLTGVTGFVGKAIVEKLLRSCPEVERIYVLLRAKRNKTPHERLQDVLQTELFQRVRENPSLLTKVTAIQGDVTLEGLGISSQENQTLRSKVSVVFHIAANVKFTAKLEDLLKTNTEGTRNVIEWAKQLTALKAFVYMSTAFSNSDREEILEKVYSTDVDPHLAIKLYSGLSARLVDSFAPKLIGGNKLNYTFSKHLAELLVQEVRLDLPVCIVRPALVTGANEEPFPGWTDNFNGMGGFFVGAGKGMIHCVYTNKRGSLDIVPVDHVVNLTLAAAFQLGSGWKAKEEVVVYNCSSTEHPFVFKELNSTGMEAFEETPFNHTVWHPSVVYVTSVFAFTLLDFFLHYIPAVLADGAQKLVGKKPKVSLLEVYKKSRRLADVLEDIQGTYYSISTENTQGLYKLLSPKDQQEFNFNVAGVNWHDYVQKIVYGYRRYVLKEADEDLPGARKRFRVLKRIHMACWWFLVVLLLVVTIIFVPLIGYILTWKDTVTGEVVSG